MCQTLRQNNLPLINQFRREEAVKFEIENSTKVNKKAKVSGKKDNGLFQNGILRKVRIKVKKRKETAAPLFTVISWKKDKEKEPKLRQNVRINFWNNAPTDYLATL